MARMITVTDDDGGPLAVNVDRLDKKYRSYGPLIAVEFSNSAGELKLTPGEALRLRSQLDAALDELQADPPASWPQAQVAAAEAAA